MNYTDDTFDSIWFIENCNGINYRVLKNLVGEYYIFCDDDVIEKSYTNYVVKSNYRRITDKIVHGDHYVEAIDNKIHSNIGPAVCCPCGLDIYRPSTNVVHYMLDGKILTEKDWMNTMRQTKYWPEIMVNMLGKSVNSSTLSNMIN